MPLYIENETHWRTPDIEKLIRSAMAAGCADASRRYKVTVIYNVKKTKVKTGKRKSRTVSASNAFIEYSSKPRVTDITIKLPKVGPRHPHTNAMVAIAASAAAPADGDLLAASESYKLANKLTSWFWHADRAVDAHTDEKEAQINAAWDSDMPPFWAQPGEALICKVKDPKKDGTYLDFLKKKEAALKRTETAIEKELAAIETSKRRLAKARKRKKEIEKSIKSAKERRG